MLKLRSSIRTRVLAIVLVPILALLAIGAAATTYLVDEGNDVKNWAEAQLSQPDINGFVDLIVKERQLSMLVVAGDQASREPLKEVQAGTDQAMTTLLGMQDQFTGLSREGELENSTKVFEEAFGQFEQFRGQVAAGNASLKQVYDFYNGIIDMMVINAKLLALASPTSETVLTESTTMDLVLFTDELQRTHALAQAALRSGGLNPVLHREFTEDVGAFRAFEQQMMAELQGQGQQTYQQLASSDAWKTLLSVEQALIQHGPVTEDTGPVDLPVNPQAWAGAAQEVGQQLTQLWRNTYRAGQEAGRAEGEDQANDALLGGAGVAAIAVVALGVALILSQQLVGRLRRLRRETLELSDNQVPSIMERLKAGEQVDVNLALPSLDYGKDEVGQVADAFNRAQRNAVSAAVAEAETREGANAVFLNIAHRSQVVVHRQLEVLDRAEHRQEDPEQLELLFQLDHLATRERRNAENLIILGGELPGRQWRNPVPLLEVVRSAVAETEEYARVRTSRIPEVLLQGTVVADVIHLLAELVDNATSFSPPDSRVEIFGNQVGKGVVLEISDQGLGMSPEEMDVVNEKLANPPEFGVMGLSTETRLGLFVVGRLGVRTGVKVRLVESEYGGIRAIVLIPSGLITMLPQDEGYDSDTFAGVPQPRSERLERMDRRDRIRSRQSGEESSQPTQVVPPAPPPLPPAPQAPSPEPSWPRSWPEQGPGNGTGQWQRQEPAVPPSNEPAPRPGPDFSGAPPLPQRTRVGGGNRADNGNGNGGNGGNGGGNGTWSPSSERPALPTRRRQENIAPQLADDERSSGGRAEPEQPEGPSAERSRDLMSAIQQGTTQARNAPSPEEATQRFDMFASWEKREGNGYY